MLPFICCYETVIDIIGTVNILRFLEWFRDFQFLLKNLGIFISVLSLSRMVESLTIFETDSVVILLETRLWQSRKSEWLDGLIATMLTRWLPGPPRLGESWISSAWTCVSFSWTSDCTEATILSHIKSESKFNWVKYIFLSQPMWPFKGCFFLQNGCRDERCNC